MLTTRQRQLDIILDLRGPMVAADLYRHPVVSEAYGSYAEFEHDLAMLMHKGRVVNLTTREPPEQFEEHGRAV